MRAFVLVPITLAIAIAVGFAVCRMMGFDPHTKEMIAAGLACLVAGELAGVPLVLARGENQAGIAQAALVGTVVHMFVSIAVAAVVVFAHLGLAGTFLYWLMAMYFATLIALVIAFTNAVRTAPIARPVTRPAN